MLSASTTEGALTHVTYGRGIDRMPKLLMLNGLALSVARGNGCLHRKNSPMESIDWSIMDHG
ncbi:hypothetical protein ACO22_01295 [Paracoccidioides brasiliensis]|uniref:Uncharacterized protein n=1 Tax=Paracoccidioides brasiliensis TaxID=121759 RepID=A0A1D2JM04_PARBR|nr:hypothetical protein ACO22_01295 [Paracoccidioides brasiliensis]